MKTTTTGVVVAQFKRWSNKAYAVFNSLGRQVKISVLLVVYLIALPFEVVFANEPQTKSGEKEDEVALEEVVVSAQRTTTTYADIARVVSVITRTEIEQSGVQSINELLEYALGVDVRQRGQHGIQADITIRGGTFDQVLVLLNGVNISDPQTGHLNLNIPVALEAIERVEIVSGATSRIYGPNAFTGVVNLVTGTYDENTSVMKLEGGEYGLWNLNSTTTLQGRQSRHLLSLGYKKSDGYIANSDFKMLNAFYQGQFYTQKAKYDFQLGRTSRNFGANTFYTAEYPNQYEDVQTNFISAKATFEGKIKFVPTVYYRRQTDRFELYRDKMNAPAWYKKHNNHLTNVYGLNLNTSTHWLLGKTAVGGDFRSENVVSNVLGKSMKKRRVRGEANAFYDKEDHRNNISLFLEHNISLWKERVSVTAGVMANYNDAFDKKIAWFPGVDMSLRLTKNVKLYGTANKALRLPTFTDLYYNTPTHKGNTELIPEKATSYESGVKFAATGVDAHIAYFFRAGKNLIDWTKLDVGDKKWQARNLADVDMSGVETALSLRPFLWNEDWDFLRSLQLSYSYTKVEKENERNHLSAYVLDNLKHKFDGELTIAFFEKWLFTTHTSWQDRYGSFEYYTLPTSKPVAKSYEPFWLVNAKLTWKQENYEVFAQVSNLLNKTYYDIGNVVQPGRWISGGVKIYLRW